jgi:hypothetical protein
MPINKNTVKTALEGMTLHQHPEVWEASGQPTEEHRAAVKSVYENLDEFRRIVLDELQNYSHSNKLFEQLIHGRLFQEKPLESPIIQKLFSSGFIELEERLDRIHHLPNIETVSKNVHAPKALNKGDYTDEVIRDIWTEFFLADFLFSNLKVDGVEKVVRANSQTAIDFYVWMGKEEWIVEVARMRKKDFQGETMPWGSQDCAKPENVSEIRKAIRSKLNGKNEQIKKFVSDEGRDFDKRIVAIKTSQEEYQDCSHIIVEESKNLMKERPYPEITHLLLIYDIETYEFVENFQARK